MKDLGDAIGMPTEADKRFIRKLILAYDRKHPGWIKATIDQARNDQRENSTAFNDKTRFGLVDKQSSRRHLFELPEELYLEIERYFPTMFYTRSHFHWFVKNFPELLLPERY